MTRGRDPEPGPDSRLLDQVIDALWTWLRPRPDRAGEYEIRVAIGNIRTAQIKSNIEAHEEKK